MEDLTGQHHRCPNPQNHLYASHCLCANTVLPQHADCKLEVWQVPRAWHVCTMCWHSHCSLLKDLNGYKTAAFVRGKYCLELFGLQHFFVGIWQHQMTWIQQSQQGQLRCLNLSWNTSCHCLVALRERSLHAGGKRRQPGECCLQIVACQDQNWIGGAAQVEGQPCSPSQSSL